MSVISRRCLHDPCIERPHGRGVGYAERQCGHSMPPTQNPGHTLHRKRVTSGGQERSTRDCPLLFPVSGVSLCFFPASLRYSAVEVKTRNRGSTIWQ